MELLIQTVGTSWVYIRDVLDPVPSDTATFGIDPCGPLPVNPDEESEGVLLEDVACPLSCRRVQRTFRSPLCVR